MFKNLFLHNLACGPRAGQDPLSRERLQPDCSPGAGWVRRLRRNRSEADQGRIEVFVPDGRLALLLKDGQPDRWFQPGRHKLESGNAKVEVRLIPAELFRDAQADRVSALPCERALLFVDGMQVAIVKPGASVGADAPAPPRVQDPLRSPASGVEEDPIRAFSFV